MKNMITLRNLKPLDVSRAGKKAYNLAFLSRSGFSVPAGAVIPVEVYHRVLTGFGSVQKVWCLPPDSLRSVCADIARHFDKCPLPQGLEREVGNFISGQKGPWIVRSSSTDEDGGVFSYAGIFTSVADNADLSQIIKALRQVWSSFWSDEAFMYRESRHAGHFGPGMAVIIQRQIEASASGVVFTRHPVNGEDVLVMNAHRGGGEELVQGRTTPFCIEMQKGSGDEPPIVISRNGEAPLDDESLMELASKALRMEKLFRYPLDMEWAFDGSFHFVQARPVTGGVVEWSADPVGEFMGERLTTMSADLFREYMESHFTAFYRDLGVRLPQGRFFDVFGGAVYARKDVLKSVELSMSDDGTGGRISAGIGLMMEKLHDSMQQYRSGIEALNALSCGNLSVGEAWEILLKAWRLFSRSDPVIHMTYLLGTLLRQMDSFENGERCRELFESHVTLEGQCDAEMFQSGLLAVMEEGRTDQRFLRWLDDTDSMPAPEPVSRFLMQFGAWSSSPFELSGSRLGEDFDQIRPFLKALHADNGMDRCGNALELQKSRRRAAHEELKELSGNDGERDGKGAMKACLDWVAYLQVERERHRRYTYMATALLRRLLLIIGSDLAARGVLAGDMGPQDVFHLTLDEMERLREADEHRLEWRDQITVRKRLWEKIRHEPFPPEFSGFAPRSAVPSYPCEGEAQVLKGMALSAGSAAGSARVIQSGESCRDISAGDILVVKSCEPYWAMYFPLISGFVSECGGALSHAAILAREYSIPAVSGIAAATAVISNGDSVLIDGESGTVTVHK